MGTPDFAVASLEAIHSSDHDVVAVVTSVDKLGGRGRNQLIESDVKKFAVKNGIPLLQPKSLKSKSFIENLRSFNADLFVVVAFRMLPEMVWSMPKLGTINLHASLLPKYRGAAPINWAIINGEKETGITTFFIEKEIDTGKIILQEKVAIGENETMGELYNRLKIAGSNLLVESLNNIESGDYIPKTQDPSQVSEAPKIFFETGEIKDHMSALAVHNLVRGLHPFPNAWLKKNDILIKIIETRYDMTVNDQTFGEIENLSLIVYDKRLFVKCSDTLLEILQIKPEGKRQMSATEYINGNRDIKRLDK